MFVGEVVGDRLVGQGTAQRFRVDRVVVGAMPPEVEIYTGIGPDDGEHLRGALLAGRARGGRASRDGRRHVPDVVLRPDLRRHAGTDRGGGRPRRTRPRRSRRSPAANEGQRPAGAAPWWMIVGVGPGAGGGARSSWRPSVTGGVDDRAADDGAARRTCRLPPDTLAKLPAWTSSASASTSARSRGWSGPSPAIPRCATRVFTPEEIAYCDSKARPAESFAGRFAAREAVIKALGGYRGKRWQDISVTRARRAGRPASPSRAAPRRARRRSASTAC